MIVSMIFKSFLDNKMSTFEEYGAFKTVLQMYHTLFKRLADY